MPEEIKHPAKDSQAVALHRSCSALSLTDGAKSALSMLWNAPRCLTFAQAKNEVVREYGVDVENKINALLGGGHQ